MKIVAVADLHGRLPEIPPCDVLVIAGDICPDISFRIGFNDPDLMAVAQEDWLRTEYARWESTIPADHILATWGNHDWARKLPDSLRTRMFVDEGCEVGRARFWFTPWVSHCGDWNWLAGRAFRKDRFADIPAGLDVLVSHGPAHKCGDRCYSGDEAGCPELRAAIQEKKPRHVFFGHIHEGYLRGREYQLGSTKLYHSSFIEKLPLTTVHI